MRYTRLFRIKNIENRYKNGWLFGNRSAVYTRMGGYSDSE